MTPVPQHIDPNDFAAAADGLADAIMRTCQAVEQETRELRANSPVDHAGHRHRKDICLLDLTRRSRALDGADPGPEVRAALRSLRDAIIENQATLRLHLNAARQIANILIDIMVEADSDRTYDRAYMRQSRQA